MKKTLSLFIALFVATTFFAQDLSTKIPKNAAFVSVFRGANVLKQVPKSELTNYHFIKDLLGNQRIKNFDDTGINISKNIYSFVSITDTISYYCVLLPIQDAAKFAKFAGKNYDKPTIIDGYKAHISSRGNEIVIWDDHQAVIANPYSMSGDTYYFDDTDYGYIEEEVLEATPPEPDLVVAEAADAVDAVEETEDAVIEIEEEVIEIEEEVEMVEMEEMDTPEMEEAVPNQAREARRQRQLAREEASRAKRAQRHNKKKNLLQSFAIATMRAHKTNSIVTSLGYQESVNTKAVVSFWTPRYSELYLQLLGTSRGMMRMIPDLDAFYKGLSKPEASGIRSISGNIFLNKNDATLEINTKLTPKMAGYYKKMGKRKFNKNFFKYFDGDKVLGYAGIAVNTENFIDVYPKIIDNLLSVTMPSQKAEISAATELISILLDEKEIGELIKGDVMFVISDMIEKEIKYTTYEYDDDYNPKKVEKTRTEPMPEFLIMASTERLDFVKKLLSIGQKYKQITTQGKSIYLLKSSRKMPFELYFVLHNDILFLTSSEYQARDIAAGKKGKTSRKAKKMARKSSTIFYANNNRILDAIPNEAFPRKVIPPLDYFRSSFKDVNATVSKVKRNTIQSTFKINTTDKEANSLKSFFGMAEHLWGL